jgi:hypothetical protein
MDMVLHWGCTVLLLARRGVLLGWLGRIVLLLRVTRVLLLAWVRSIVLLGGSAVLLLVLVPVQRGRRPEVQGSGGGAGRRRHVGSHGASCCRLLLVNSWRWCLRRRWPELRLGLCRVLGLAMRLVLRLGLRLAATWLHCRRCRWPHSSLTGLRLPLLRAVA